MIAFTRWVQLSKLGRTKHPLFGGAAGTHVLVVPLFHVDGGNCDADSIKPATECRGAGWRAKRNSAAPLLGVGEEVRSARSRARNSDDGRPRADLLRKRVGSAKGANVGTGQARS